MDLQPDRAENVFSGLMLFSPWFVRNTIPGAGKIFRLATRLRHRVVPGPIILMYHRITEILSDPHGLCVSPDHFRQHLDVLLGLGRPVGIENIVKQMNQNYNWSGEFAVTFDDGYADNLEQAKPLLEAKGVPATVFVATGPWSTTREFWWDELEKCILRPAELPESLELTVRGRKIYWQHANGDTPRSALFRKLHALLLRLDETGQREVMDALLAWAKIDDRPRPTHRILSPQGVVDLTDGGLIEVGAHTVNHSLLPGLSPSVREHEIRSSKIALEKLLNREIPAFAYPYGGYNHATAQLVRRTGFSCACTTQTGSVSRRANAVLMPRLGIRDWDGDLFERKISFWLHK